MPHEPVQASDTHTLPAVHALHLVALVQRWNVSADELLAPLGLSEAALADPGARLTIPQVVALVERARALTGEAGLGFHMGMQMRVSAHGYLGFAAMTAATVRESLELSMRYIPTRTDAMRLQLHEGGGAAALVLEERAQLGAARDFVVLAVLIGIWQIGRALTDRALDGSMDLAFAEPAYMPRFGRFGGRMRFGQPANQLVFDAGILDLPMKMADPVALRLAREQCERELDRLDVAAGARARAAVERAVPHGELGFRSLAEVARELRVSPRTLKRRLAAEGASFSDILTAQRRERALLLLRSPERSLDDIAAALGYSDVANFTRAFRRWTGTTPGAYRRGALTT